MRFAILIALTALLAGTVDAQRPRQPRNQQQPATEQPAQPAANRPVLNPADGVPGARFPSISPDGNTVVFTLHGDIWSMPATGGRATRLSYHEAYDTRPMITPDGANVVFISDRAGSHDLWIMPIDGGPPRRLTYHAAVDIPTGFTRDGKSLIFYSTRDMGWNRSQTYSVWRMPLSGGTPVQITSVGGREATTPDDGTTLFYIDGSSDSKVMDYKGTANDRLYRQVAGNAPEQVLSYEGNTREPSVSADGKRLHFTREVNGSYELFITDLATNETRQATQLGEGGLSNVSFTTDDSKAVFVWKFYLWSLDLTAADAKPKAMKVEIREDSRGDHRVDRTFTSGVSRAMLARDGRNIVFSLGGDIWIMGGSGGQARQVTDDAFQNENPQLSPDSRTISFYSNRSGNSDIWLIDVNGQNLRQVTSDPADDFFQTWSPDGTALVFTSTRSGNKDIWLQKMDGSPATRLTTDPADDDDAVFTPDGRYIVFDSARGGNADIWIMDADGANPRRVYGSPAVEEVPVVSPDSRFIAFDRVSGGGPVARQEVLVTDFAGSGEVLIGQGSYPSFTPDGKEIMYVNPRGELVFAPAPAGIVNGRTVPLLATKKVSEKEEMLRAFDVAHTSFKESFYDPKFHGRDWDALGRKYRELVNAAGSREEYLFYLNRMVGEVSASHTGANANTTRATPFNTGLTGMSLTPETYQGNRQRLRVDNVERGGPADQAWIRNGDYIFRVEGRPLAATDNFYALLEGKEGQEVSLFVADNEEGRNLREVKLTCEGFGQRRNRGYQNYIRDSKTLAARSSRNQVAYIHIPQMSQQALAAFQNELANPQVQAAKALVIDVRDNGGGNIHQALIDILSRKPYAYIRNRNGQRIGQPPVHWDRPIAVLINERSYSDAEVFPHAMKTLNMATIVGVQTPGAVIGTRDIVLPDGTRWRLPGSGFFSIDGTNQEHNGCKPDLEVDISPADRLAGRDTQLEAAVKLLVDKLRGPAAPEPGPAPTPTPTKPEREGDFALPEEFLAPLPEDDSWRVLPWWI